MPNFMYLSIIIPVWNEANKISADIREIIRYADGHDLSIEVIIVDDGSEDNTYYIANETAVPEYLKKKVLQYTPHRGKGYAVRRGIAESKGELVMFMDSGQNVPMEFIDKGIKQIEENECDILIGSRYLPESIIKRKLIWYRHFTSRWFRKIVKLYLQIPDSISDTQCGFKIFKGIPARQLFKNCRSDGFIFDLEIILMALKEKFKICELAIEWTCDRDSRLSLLKAFLPVFKDLRKLRQTYV